LQSWQEYQAGAVWIPANGERRNHVNIKDSMAKIIRAQ
jgi:hypothetical protein